MRAGWLVLAICACGPKAANTPRSFDDDLESGLPRSAAAPSSGPSQSADRLLVEPAPPPSGAPHAASPAPPSVADLPDARRTVAPRLSGDRFVGWQLVQLLDHTGPLHDIDLASGDVLLAVNGSPLSRPEQLQAIWDALRTANEVTARLWRGDMKFELHFTIEPQVH